MMRTIAVLLAVTGCEPAVTAEALSERGPYPVGYRTLETTYQPEGLTGERTIPLEVWYPALEEGDEADYAVAGIVSIEADGAFDAPPPIDGTLPVAVYSHGSSGVALLGYPFAEHLASHGWLVVAPDHVGNTSLNLFLGTSAPLLQNMLVRPQDVSASLDALDNLLADDPLVGQADTSAVLAIGHSFGGYTIFASAGARPGLDAFDTQCVDQEDDPSCVLLSEPAVRDAFTAGFLDERLVALVPQAPAIGFFDPAEISAVALPTMLQSGREDVTTTAEESAEPAWAALDGDDDLWIDMRTGGHLTFLSVCDDVDEQLLLGLFPNALEDGCGPNQVPVGRALESLSAYILGQARWHVLGEPQVRRTLRGDAFDEDFEITLP